MAEDSPDNGEKTEAATPRRLQRAREQGQVAISRELATLAALTAALLAGAMAGPDAARELTLCLRTFLGHADATGLAGSAAFTLAWQAAVAMVAPILLPVLIAGAGTVLLQSGFLLNPSGLQPDIGRVDPRAGVRRLLSGDSLVEAAKSLVRLAILSAIIWHVLSAALPAMLVATFQTPQTMARHVLPPVIQLCVAMLIVQAVVAAFDVAWIRMRFSRRLRMSRQDIREEMKETDGDPKIKQRIRQLRMQRARRRMFAAVKKATVVIVNPTHYAVALAYDRAKNRAPRVVAKGTDLVATRIRELAADHRIPVVTNPPLARALYRTEIDTDIPPEQYKAVAEIIAYVWGLQRRRTR